MAEEEPIARTRCQHCPEVIEKHPGENDWWQSLKTPRSLICSPQHLDLKHKPMPRVPA